MTEAQQFDQLVPDLVSRVKVPKAAALFKQMGTNYAFVFAAMVALIHLKQATGDRSAVITP